MLPVVMDPECREFVLHLLGLAAGTSAADPGLADSFSRGLLYHHPRILAADGDSSNAAIKNILQLLFRVCGDAPQEYLDLLEKILRHLPLGQILRHVSEDVIFQNINVMFLDVLVAKTKAEEPSYVLAFVEEKNLCSRLVKLLFEPATTAQMAYKITDFLAVYFRRCQAADPGAFWQKWVQSPGFSAQGLAYSGPSAFFSYVEILRVMDACRVPQESMEAALDFDVGRMLDSPDDADFAMEVLVDFLVPYLRNHELAENSLRVVHTVMDHLGRLSDAGSMLLLVAGAYDRLLGAMLQSVVHKPLAVGFLGQHPPKVDVSTTEGARMFCQLDLAVFDNPADVFRRHFAAKRIESVPEPVFYAMVHLISDDRFFRLLVDSGNFSGANLELLPRNLWLETVLRLALHPHSALYVFDVPGLFSSLVAGENMATDETLEMKRAIFRRLRLNSAFLGSSVHSDAVHQMAVELQV